MERLRRWLFPPQEKRRPDWLVVGLGNPGERYALTRHNVGFQALDGLAKRYGLTFRKMRQDGLLALGEVGGSYVALLKPLTYMNRSGSVVAPLFRSYGLPKDRLLVIYDDLDLPLGKIRLREGGSAGGHRGMASIIDLLGNDIPRLRVGIGLSEGDPQRYVLEEFRAQELPLLEEAHGRIVTLVECLLREGISAAMNSFN